MTHIHSSQEPIFYTNSKSKVTQDLKVDPNKSLHSISNNKNETTKPINMNNQAETLTTPVSPNNTSGNPFRRFLFGQSTKHTPSTNGKTSPGPSNHYPELELSYITSRLIVMKTPCENSSNGSTSSTAERVRDLLDTKHPDSYMLYPLDPISNGQLPYQREFFHNKVHDLPLFDEKQTPNLVALLWLCQKATSFLLESPSNVVILHCADGKHQVAFGACALLAYHKIFIKVDQIVQYYEQHRHTRASLTMSQKRYIQYLCDLSAGLCEQPHFNKLILQTINLTPVPLVNKHKNSCRPFIDIYDNEHKKIFSTSDETAKLRVYSASDSTCSIPVNVPFNGDITIHVTHATINTSRRTHEGGTRICELTINSNFSSLNHSELSYSKNELDGLDPNGKYPTSFRIIFDTKNEEKSSIDTQDLFMKQLDETLNQPLALFRDESEFKQKINEFEKQFKNQNGDANGTVEDPVSPSSVVRRPTKKDEPLSPISSNSPSPRSSSGRLSDSFSNNSYNRSSYINPFQLFKEKNSESSSQTSKASSIEPKQIQSPTSDATLLDLDEDDSNKDPIPNIPAEHSSQPIPSSPPPSCIPIPIPVTLCEPNRKSSISTVTTTKIPEPSGIKKPANTSSSPTQPKGSVRSQPAPHSQKSIVDMDTYFGELDGFVKTTEAQRTPSKPSTIIDIRKAVVDKDLDPKVRKVRDWTEGKKKNLRALLSTLSTVTWPECSWNGCQMNELLTPDQVTKVYRKAVLHIHPDKLRGDPNEPLANLIFVELNAAWSQFQQESNMK